MKIAIISDIHSNPAALTKVLKDARSKGCEKIICLGDIVGYGYAPNECIDICREEGIESLMGNHDAALVGELELDWFNDYARSAVLRQRGMVSEDNKKWLLHLPYTRLGVDMGLDKPEDKFQIALSHGTLEMPSRFDYILYVSDAALEFLTLAGKGVNSLFVGHTHCANVYFYDNGRISENYIDLDDEEEIDLNQSEHTIINVGSVGYPRNQPYSIYGIYDTAKHIFKHRILPFDFDDYIAQMEQRGIKAPLWVERRKKQAEERQIGFR